MKSADEFKEFCVNRGIAYRECSPYHFQVTLPNGVVADIWPTKDKYQLKGGCGGFGVAFVLGNAFPASSYLVHYIKMLPVGEGWVYIDLYGNDSKPFPTRDECLFEFGKYCKELESKPMQNGAPL